jgi:nucleoside-triphosphatase
MELYNSSFFPAVLKVLESNIPILASIPVPKFGRDIPAGKVSIFSNILFLS